MKLSKEEYAKKIAVASLSQLVIINFELLLDFLTEAESNFEDSKAYIKNIDKARGFLKMLASSLDMRYALSRQLLPIYIYVNKLFVTRIVKIDLEALSEAKNILSILKEGFMAIQDESETNDNESKIFAGLTYNHRGELDEYFEGFNRSEYMV